MLCEIFSRAYSRNEVPHTKYIELFYLALRQLSPVLTIAVSPDKIRSSSSRILSYLLVFSQTNSQIELVNSIEKDPYRNYVTDNKNDSKTSLPESSIQQQVSPSIVPETYTDIPPPPDAFSDTPIDNQESLFNYSIQNLAMNSQNEITIFRPNRNGLFSNSPDNISFDSSIKIFNDVNSNVEPNVPKNMQEIYELLLPDLLLSVSYEKNSENMSILVNTILLISMQDSQKSNELCVRTVELLLSELSQAKDPGDRELQIIRGLRQMSIVLKHGVEEYLAKKVIAELYGLFFAIIDLVIEGVYFQVTTEILLCLRWWINQNNWLINNEEISEKISKIWKTSMNINTLIKLNKNPNLFKPSQNQIIPKFESNAIENSESIMFSNSFTSSAELNSQSMSSNINTQALPQVPPMPEIPLRKTDTKESTVKSLEAPSNSKKKSFFNSSRVKMAKRMVGDALKIADTHLSDFGTSKPRAKEPSIIEEVIEEKPLSYYINKFVENSHIDANVDFENMFANTNISQRVVFNLYRTVIEFANFLNQAYLGYSLDSLWPSKDKLIQGVIDPFESDSGGRISNYSYGQKLSPVEYFYYKESSTLLRVAKINDNEFSIEIHSPYGSHPYNINIPHSYNDDSYLESIFESELINKLQRSAMVNSSSQLIDSSQMDMPGQENNSSYYNNSKLSNTNELSGMNKSLTSPEIFTKSPIKKDGKRSSRQPTNESSLSIKNHYNRYGSLQDRAKYAQINKNENMENYIDSLSASYINDVKFINNFMAQISEKSEKLKDKFNLSHLTEFESIGKNLEANQQGKMNLYRLPIFLADQAAYKLNVDLESRFRVEDLKTLAPFLEIKAGLHLLNLQNEESEEKITSYLSLVNKLNTFSIDNKDSALKVGQREFTLPKSLGYSLKFLPIETAAELGASQFIFYSTSDNHQSMDLLHFSLRLQSEGITGIKKVDKHFENIMGLKSTPNKFDVDSYSVATTNSFSLDNSLWNEDYDYDIDSIEGSYPLWVFYIISPINNVNGSLVHIKKIIYSTSQSDTDYLLLLYFYPDISSGL
ncbi:hypothetical protein AYI70_g4524 [Smittium culicis]|uniref:Uncharacterized protein n=1 Tax=Smittium culicis TaxID=133412 RepID=A0A1R1XYK7_9FUNG|nr:hypothetical protein AYI70_g4524 [Smittium culicis]